MLYVGVSCFVVRGCAVSRKYIDVFNCDVFSVVNVDLDHLTVCVVCINGRRYVCCSECNGVSNGCNEPTSCLVQPIDRHGAEVMYFGCVCFRGELGCCLPTSMTLASGGSQIFPLVVHNGDAICMCVLNKQFSSSSLF